MKTIKELKGLTDKNGTPERPASREGNYYEGKQTEAIGPGMNERIQRLRKLSFEVGLLARRRSS